MDRRRFIKLCGTTAAMAGLQGSYLETVRAGETKTYNRVKLVDGQGNPLKAKQLSGDEAYIFHYPFKGTPCFLINLKNKAGGAMTMTSDEGDYQWKGGVGPNGNLVAYTAICAHQLSYAAKDHTPLTYYGGTESKVAGASGMIVCCEHDRVYDPAQGGKMVAANKQATQPLSAIVIEHDSASDEIYAVGVVGGVVFDEFFRSYKRVLMAEYGPGVAREEVTESSATVLLSQFSKIRDQC